MKSSNTMLFWIAFLALIPARHPARGATDREAVPEIVQQFFDGMEHRDVASSAELLMPDGQYFGYREKEDGLAGAIAEIGCGL